MDCGPAALEALLLGHGIHVSGGRLREACQTDVDGTSIDTLEEVAVQLGLEAEQVVIPADHVLLEEAHALPALAMVRLPDGASHFVVLWRQVAGWVQVMDPAVGRRWLRVEQVLRDLYIHEQEVPAEDWAEWADSEALRGPLAARMRALGLSDDSARATPAGPRLAALDAALRMTASAIPKRRPDASGLQVFLDALTDRVLATPGAIPDAFWGARPAAEADGVPQVTLRGAVLLTVRGCVPPADDLPPGLRASLETPVVPPLVALYHRLDPTSRRWMLVLCALSGLAAAAMVVEASLFHLLLDVEAAMGTGTPAGLVGLLVAVWLAVGLGLDLAVTAGLQRLGRGLTVRLQAELMAKIPHLSDRYVASRLVSDLAERSHHLHRIKELPELGAQLIRAAASLMGTTVAVAWLDGRLLPVALASGVSAVLVPAILQVPLTERELRARTAAGGLGRFLLDAVEGAVPLRAHAGGSALRRDQEGLLVRWLMARREERSFAVLIEGLCLAMGTFWAILLLWWHVGDGHPPNTALLLAWWALRLPIHGQALSALARQLAPRRNALRRVLELLEASDTPFEAPPQPASGPVAITLDGVCCAIREHPLLDDVSLHIDPGEHVAVVGRSGAGKSTLVGLLLGWHRVDAGRLLVDGQPLTPERLPALRARTAWMDPMARLAQGSLLQNLRLGARSPLETQLSISGLDALLPQLPDGLSTLVGHRSSPLRGGAAQRVRIGRALGRSDAGLVLADEALRGLSGDQRQQLLTRIRQHWRSATLLWVTHDLHEASTFDRVLVLEEGMVVEDGSPGELAAADGAFATLCAAREARVQWEAATPGWTRKAMEGP
jgi:ATP-binding cassette subfamily B protein